MDTTIFIFTIAWALFLGLLLLKIPDPTKHPSTPSCISKEQSAGVANPPAAKLTTGSRPSLAVS